MREVIILSNKKIKDTIQEAVKKTLENPVNPIKTAKELLEKFRPKS
jgi:hypothetical protein